jgi:hypothetical protein
VVPAPTNWRPGVPDDWSPPDCCTSWLAKVTFSESGLNCTGTTLPPGFSVERSCFSSMRLALTTSAMAQPFPGMSFRVS